MKEMLSELRLRDYMLIGFILIALFLVMNIQKVVDGLMPKPNTNNFPIEVNAKILNQKPLNIKLETHMGSKLKKIGYQVELEYTLDTVQYLSTSSINYNDYSISKSIIDRLMAGKNKIVPIRINKENHNSFILNINSQE